MKIAALLLVLIILRIHGLNYGKGKILFRRYEILSEQLSNELPVEGMTSELIMLVI